MLSKINAEISANRIPKKRVSMKPYLLIVTGYSGAGKTTVLKALEDSGFFCVDNLPIPLIPAFLTYCANSDQQYSHIALGIDIRAGSMMQELIAHIREFAQLFESIKIFFLTASSATLLKRFQETRRKHPLANVVSLIDAIEQEKTIMKLLLSMADIVVDTGNFNLHQLRAYVRASFLVSENKPQMVVNLISFGFKYGVPQECNFVYDVRALPNPHFISALRPLTGLDPAIREYLFAQSVVQDYWRKLHDFIQYTLCNSYAEGRTFMHIAIGCTGGRHRSVAFVQELAKSSMDSVLFLASHRDIDRTESV
jgi:UPF0042 nucleotide-binding protein